jgi:hypothetical protein
MFLLLTAVACVLFGCSDGVFNLMNRTSNPPFEDKPVVVSFETPLTLYISWAYDEGADSYTLYRDTTPTGGFTNMVYTGTGLLYTDTAVQNETWYYYKLAKKRGKDTFTTTLYSFGVGNNVPCDQYEDNNDKSRATLYENNTIDANIYYYQDAAGNVIMDTDWYEVLVPAKKSLIIRFINYLNIPNDNGIRFGMETIEPQPVELDDTRTITNDTLYDAVYYFRIIPDPGLFSSIGIGGSIGNYTIAFYAIQDPS